jgi:NitT/TauT family transport system permease protein
LRVGRFQGLLLPAALILLWQLAAVRLGKPFVLPTVTAVWDELLHPLRDHYNTGSLVSHTGVSVLRVMIGFMAAAVAGTLAGLVMGSSRTTRRLVEPVVEILRPLCPIAWIPFAIAVFKLTTLPQLAGVRHTNTILDHVQVGMLFVLFWGGFFPVLINTLDGVASVNRGYLRLAHALGASPAQTFLHVRLPAAMPMITTGLRQGIGVCWFVIIAAEMLPGSDCGIGYFLIYAADQSDMACVVAAMVVIGGMGALLSAAMTRSMRTLVAWHGKE